MLPSSFAHKAIIALHHRDLSNLQDQAAVMHTEQLANRAHFSKTFCRFSIEENLGLPLNGLLP